MNEEREQILQHFLKSIAELYGNVENWLSSTSLQITPEDIELNEEAYGTYKAQKLVIKDIDGIRKIADIIPVGAWVIGANGRVDLIGKRDKVILVNLEKGGPTMTTTVSSGDHEETSLTKFYQGIEEAGWYWIEDRRRGKAYRIDKTIFYELLTEVSDYDVR